MKVIEPSVKPTIGDDIESKVKEAFDKQWDVIVWNDPINLMTYVVMIFMRILAMNKTRATKHMLEVHKNGRSLVARETKERAEMIARQLQDCGLTSTIEQSP